MGDSKGKATLTAMVEEGLLPTWVNSPISQCKNLCIQIQVKVQNHWQ